MQQINGEPGSPDLSVTLDGKQLLPLPMAFGSVLKESAKDSVPCWPPQVAPPLGAPDSVTTTTDDVGFGAPSIFGGIITIPTADRIAHPGRSRERLAGIGR